VDRDPAAALAFRSQCGQAMVNRRIPSSRTLFVLSTLTAIAGCGVVEMPMADEAAPACDPLAAFDPPQPVLMTNAPGSSADPALSADDLTLYLTRISPAGDHDLFVATRSPSSTR
jgi:hypothetical protein